ncbi:MAG: PQQ-like beta-propeller repeat protein, partial [Candidatus Coatesbacteria bacterium]|nr:PQQ-like beta-propeller repeat protein [Candidatus Coatesbacteria bacterium]
MMGRFRCALMVSILVLVGLIANSASFAQGEVWPTYLYDARNSGRCPYIGPNGPFLGWTYPGTYANGITIATDGSLRFTTGINQRAYALHPDGTFMWSFYTGSQMQCSPAIATDNSIVFQGDDGPTYRVDAGGDMVWSYDGTGGAGWWITSPVISDELNLVFVLQRVGGAGTLHAIRMSGLNQGAAVWTQIFSNNVRFEVTSPAFDGDTVYVTGFDTNVNTGALLAVEASTGTVKWTYPPCGIIDDITKSSPSVSENGEFIYFGDDGDAVNEAVLYCVASDGTLAWSWDSPIADAGILNAPAIGTDGTLYVVDTKANLFAIASDGTLKWSVSLIEGVDFTEANAIIDGIGTIYITTNGGLVFAVSPFGHIVWAYRIGDYHMSTLLSPGSIGTDGTLYFSTRAWDTVYTMGSGCWVTNATLTPQCGSSATIFEFTVDCVFPATMGTLQTVQVYLDDGVTVVDLSLGGGTTWTGTVSSLAEGPYQYYIYYETWGGFSGTIPAAGWLPGMDVDNTAPVSQCWTNYRCWSGSPIEVGFMASDYFTDVTNVSLWYRRTPDCEGQKWWGDWTLLTSTNATIGVFILPWSLEGRIEFLTIAEDCANIEAKSTADCWTKYDDTAPVTTVTSPSNRWGGPGWEAPIRIDYDVDESCTYEPDVQLWYRYDGGNWTYDQMEEGSGRQGYFNFNPSLDGEYTFGCVTIDNCGNSEGTPSTIYVLIYDTTPPVSEVVDAPECDTDGTFNVGFMATDASISPNVSGVGYVWLYYQYEGGAWLYYGQRYCSCADTVSDTFSFTAPLGDGVYGFYVVARDCCGNTEAYPDASTPPDMETIVDTVAPRSRAIATGMTNSPLIYVNYEASDETSGVDTVQLYWNLDGGAWTLYAGPGDIQAGPTGTFPFEYNPPDVGVLGFYTRATDSCGNQEAVPTALTPPDCTTAFDNVPPVSIALDCTSASEGTL